MMKFPVNLKPTKQNLNWMADKADEMAEEMLRLWILSGQTDRYTEKKAEARKLREASRLPYQSRRDFLG